MKFTNLAILSLAYASLAAANESGCIETVEEGKDYFPDKVLPQYSTNWSVSYEKTYKVVKNIAKNETYLLYQCGTEPPAEQMDGIHAAILSVPIEEAGFSSTTYFPFFEILGAREQVAAYFGGFGFVSSPCLNQLFDQGLVDSIPDANNVTAIDRSLDLPSFVGSFSTVAFEPQLSVSASTETTNLAVFEWIKMFATFLNLEGKANEIFADVQARYTCAQSNAELIACDSPKPKVLWGSYSEFCGGWSYAKCPNYYCEFAQSCQAEILLGTGSVESEPCGTTYMTTEEFVELGKDADHWIYPSNGFESTLQDFPEIAEFKSVQNQEVYDTSGVGPNAWFEQRLVEPDVVLQDFCNVVGRENLDAPVPHERVWFQNVFTDGAVVPRTCTDPAAPLVPRFTQCLDLPVTSCGAVAETEAPSVAPVIEASEQPSDENPGEEDSSPSNFNVKFMFGMLIFVASVL